MDQRWVNARATGIHVCTVVPSLSTVAIIIDNRTVLPNVFPTSPLQLSLKLYFVNSIKLLVLDSSRSYDTARVGLPTAYIYRYVAVIRTAGTSTLRYPSFNGPVSYRNDLIYVFSKDMPMRVQQPFLIANLLHRQFDRTHAWCYTMALRSSLNQFRDRR